MEVSSVLSFLTPVLILLKIYIVEFIFSLSAERRKLFWLKFVGYGLLSVVLVLTAISLYVIFSGSSYEYGAATEDMSASIFNFILYFSIFFIAIGVYYMSYKQSIVECLACGSIAYAVQHLSNNTSTLMQTLNIIPSITWMYIFDTILFVTICTLLYIFFIRKYPLIVGYNRKNTMKVIISLIVILVCIGITRLTSDLGNRTDLSIIADSIYSMVCCFLILYIQFSIAQNRNLHFEVDVMKELLHKEKKQYELSKETIDLINIKCHDLKYQISELRNNYSEQNLSSIEKAVMIYDSTVKTGNDVLDVILTEKKLLCESKDIHVTYSIKGDLIPFMENLDIYTLFGNLLSNAIESVSTVNDVENRCMSVNIISVGEMVVIHMENYYEGKIDFENGVPITTKDKSYHGFGMKSIERIVKKYGGELSIIAEHNTFTVDILLPSNYTPNQK